MPNAIGKVVSIFGSQAELGRRLQVKRATVNSWVKARNKIPPVMAIKIEELTDSKVTRSDLRPDLFK